MSDETLDTLAFWLTVGAMVLSAVGLHFLSDWLDKDLDRDR